MSEGAKAEGVSRHGVSGIKAGSVDLSLQRGVETLAHRILRRFLRHRLAVAGLVILSCVVGLAIFAPVVARWDPLQVDLSRFRAPPDEAHWLGTDTLGRDVWSRLVYAARVSVSVGLVAVGIRMVIGVLVGALAGYFRGWVDTILMRLVDTIMSFPSLFLIISLVAVLGPSIYNIMAILGFLGWPPLARLVRAQILAEREKDYITAARCLGIPDSRILLRHLLPSTASVVVVNATFGIAGAIMSEAGLSFLGLGVQPPNPSWGNMLLQAQSLTVLESMPWLWVPPGIAILITVIAINFIGDGLRDALDPRAIY